MLPNAFIELRNDVYRDIYGTNRWVYVKMQSLLEYLCNDYFDENPSLLGIDRTLMGRFSTLAYKLRVSDDIIKTFHIVNWNANLIKHYQNRTKSSETRYRKVLVEEAIRGFNILFSHLFGERGKLYQIDYFYVNLDKQFVIHSVKPDAVNQVKDTVPINHQKLERIKEDYGIFINTGIGNQDFGFIVSGISFSNVCNIDNASIYAVIFNFMQRSRVLRKTEFISSIESKEKTLKNYKNIYRYEIILLLMIKNNFFNDYMVDVETFDGNMKELEIALAEINWYSGLISLLMNIEPTPFILKKSSNPYTISINGNPNATIFALDLVKKSETIKNFWFENTILYDVHDNIDSEKCLKYLLKDFFGFKDFKPGQLKAMQFLLSGYANSIVILPTGGGKSLLFYFLAMLQPKMTLIISPTEILIKDQIRNLKELHNFEDASFIQTGVSSNGLSINTTDISEFQTLLLYLTPEQLMYEKIIKSLIYRNVNNKLANIILDEVHTISNWSHNFRPEYLILSYNLLEHLDNTRYIGFTATANYRVLQDVIIQLKLNKKNVISPVELKRNNIRFRFLANNSDEAIANTFYEHIKNQYRDNAFEQKTIVFTKGESISQQLKHYSDDFLKHNIDVFKKNDLFSYDGFVYGRKSIIVCEEELGVGINIPMVNNVIHYGTPISKGQYVQEIGRVDRFGEGGQSTVVFRNRQNLNNYEQTILDFNTSMAEILSTLKMLDECNDIKLTFKKIVGHLEHYAPVAKGIRNLNRILQGEKNSYRVSYVLTEYLNQSQQQIYMFFLFKMGIIKNWYIVEKNKNSITYDIFMKSGHNELSSVIKSSVEYIFSLGYYSHEIFFIENAKSISEIIFIVQSWYYNQFLRYHREQLLNVMDFFEMNSKRLGSQELIVEQLADYFSGSLLSSGEDEKSSVLKMTINEIIESVKKGVTSSFYSQVERILENEYISKLDLYISIYQIIISKHVNISRIRRSLTNSSQNIYFDLLDNFHLLYLHLDVESKKLDLINVVAEFISYDDLMMKLYTMVLPDRIYYGFLTKHLNTEIAKMKGV